MKSKKKHCHRTFGFRTIYDQHAKAFRITYKELLDEPPADSPAILDREVLDGVSFMIGEQALLIGLLHQRGELRATTLENCIQKILVLLDRCFRNIQRAQFIAGDPLARTLRESIMELADCTINLLECIGNRDDRDGVPELAMKVFNAYGFFINDPNTRSAVTWVSILEVANNVDEASLEIEKIAGSVVVKSVKEERPVKELAIHVVSDIISVIKELPHITKIQNETDLPRLIPVIEGLLKKSIRMKDGVNEIKDSLYPLREVRILQSLNDMKASSSFMEQELQHYYRRESAGCLPKIDILSTSLNELEDALVNLFVLPE